MGRGALQELLSTRRVRRAEALPGPLEGARWRLCELAGRLVELSGDGASAALTVAVGLVLEAQRASEPVAWITVGESFFPPDLEESGVDLDALVVIRIDAGQDKSKTVRALRAAAELLRSGGFGLVLVDLGRTGELPLAAQTRLQGLAQKHDSALVCLTQKSDETPSLGSLISLRAAARRRRLQPGLFACEVRVLKDKRRGPGWAASEVCRGPAGLR